MTPLFIATSLALAIGALFLAGRSYKTGEHFQHTPSMVISLAAAFIACSAAGDILLQQPDQDTQTLKRILGNLAFFAGIPLIASAILASAWKYDWSRAAWGRWLLVLFALFELCRRSDFGATYSQIMAVICAAVIAISFLKFKPIQTKLIGIISSAALAVSLLIYSPSASITNSPDPELFRLSLAITMALFSIALSKAEPCAAEKQT